jgi:hypothetical protein
VFMNEVVAKKALYIKLGVGGEWEKECIKDGRLRFGYHEVPHDVCMSGNWAEVERLALNFSKDRGAATRHVNQIRKFYEEDDKTLWITLHADRLWWCFADANVQALPDNTKQRQVIGSWHDSDVNGMTLLKGTLSGKLLAVHGFQGTICSVSDIAYLLNKISGTVQPHVLAAQKALADLQLALIPLIKRLDPKDLETLTDLIFRQCGWQRTGVAGGTEKDIDLDLISPITQERIAVQIKSKAAASVWRDYRDRYADMRGFNKFYFVTHSPDTSLIAEARGTDDDSFIFWGVEELALQAARGGLTGWLTDKAT